jgi:predicted MPP superfamily phosphohydrolase
MHLFATYIDPLLLSVTYFGFLSSIAVLLVIYGFLEPHMLVTTKRTSTFPIRGLRIVIIGDFHVGPFKSRRFLERVINKVNAQEPDLVLLVGDFLFNRFASPKPLSVLSKIKSKYGCFAVLGNHENGHVLRHRKHKQKETHETPLVQTLRTAGIRTLHNETAIINLNKHTQLCLVGIEDLWSGLDDLPQALSTVPKGMPSILLSHNPDIILDPDSRKVDMIVSGHTHAGQVRIPFIGAIGTIAQEIGQKYDQGIFPLSDNTQLVITRGLGEASVPFRFCAPPEVLVLTTTA